MARKPTFGPYAPVLGPPNYAQPPVLAPPPRFSSAPFVPPGISPPRPILKGRDVSIQHTARENISTQFSSAIPQGAPRAPLGPMAPMAPMGPMGPRSMFLPRQQDDFDFRSFWKTLFDILAKKKKKSRRSSREESSDFNRCCRDECCDRDCDIPNAIKADNGGPYQKIKSWWTKGNEKYPPMKIIEKTTFFSPEQYDQIKKGKM